MLKRRERTEVRAEALPWRFPPPPVSRSAQRVALLAAVRKSFGEIAVLKDLDLEIWRGDRIALVGPNGCGKSTLLKVVAGRLPADHGSIEIGGKVVLHYLAQHVLETLTAGRTVLDEMQAWAPGKSPGQLRSLLGIFQFSDEDVFKKVEVLSGGEKNRLALARLTLDPGNFLLLDEPTNHLDLPTREALEDALAGFAGTLLFVSHDRYFINRVATRVAAFDDRRLLLYDGGDDNYLSALRGGVPGKAPRGAAGIAVLPRARPPAPAAAEGARPDRATGTTPGAKRRDAGGGGGPGRVPPGRGEGRRDAQAPHRPRQKPRGLPGRDPPPQAT